MTDIASLEYGFLGIIVLMIFFAFLIGTHKMLQVIVATSFISLVTLGWSGVLSFFAHVIIIDNTFHLFGFGPEQIALFINSAKITTGIIIFIALLFYIVQYTSSTINLPDRLFNSKLFQLILSPLAIIMMILGLSISVFGVDIFSFNFLELIQTRFGETSLIFNYIQYLPIALLLQGLLTLFIVFPRNKTKKLEMNFDDDYEKTIYEKQG